MTPSSVLQILNAAEGDPVLAAWAGVLHEHGMPANTEVSPYDHLEVFQYIFSCGFIGSSEYNSVNEKSVFFSGKTPNSSDVQAVLNNLQTSQESEEKMSTKPLFNAFKNQGAITTTPPARGLSNNHQVRISGPSSQPAMQAFSHQVQHPTIQNRSMRTVPNPSFLPQAVGETNRGLQCSTPDPMMSTGLDQQIWCCGVECELEDIGAEAYDGGDTETGQPYIEFSFHSTCVVCKAKGCHAVEKPHPRGSFT